MMDLTTRTTTDVEAWRASIADRRAEAARHRALDAAALVAAHAPRPRKPRAARKPRAITDRTPRTQAAPKLRVPRQPNIRPCVTCGRPTRSANVRAPQAPGTVRRIRDGLCQTCAHPDRVDRTTGATEVAAIAAAYTAGATVPEVARQTGRAVNTVRRALHRAGISPRDDRATHSGRYARVRNDPATIARVRDLYLRAGMTQPEAAQALGVSTKSVQRIMAAHGIPARPGQPRVASDNARDLRDAIVAAGTTIPEIRRWAVASGQPCPRTGMVTRALAEAYITAHRAAARCAPPTSWPSPRPSRPTPASDDSRASSRPPSCADGPHA